MSPLAVIAGLIGVSYGVLNVYGRVLWPSISPAIASLAIILILMLWPDRTTSVPLAVGTLIGAFGQLFAQLPDMSRCGLNFQLITRPVKGLGSYLALLWPAVFGTSIGQLTIYIDSFFCSNISEGAWTAISNANRIIQLPLGVLITAMIVPMLPRFAEHASQNKFDLLKKDFLKSLRFMLFMVMPLATVLILLPHQIVEVLFQRGAFNAHSTALVTTALIFYVPSILFYVGRDLITRAFYAMQDSRTPYYVAIVAIIVKAGLNWLFVYQLGWGVGGISFATSIITALNLVLLAFILRTKIGRLGFGSLVIPVTKILVACLAMGVAMFMMQAQLGLLGLMGGLPAVVSKLLCILVVSFMGLLIYAVVSYLLHVDDLFLVLEKYGLRKSSP
jgi:putative peptidoglycan lipid II flippase